MSKEIQIFSITAQIASKIDTLTTNKITTSFQLDGQTQSTDPVEHVQGKPIAWENSIKIAFGNDQTVNVKLFNAEVLLASCIFNVPSTFQENENIVELLSQNKEKVATLSFKSTIFEQKKQESPIKKKTQKTIPLEESSQKNNNQQSEPVQNNLSTSIKQPQQNQSESPQKRDIKLSDRPGKKLTQNSERKPEEKTIENQKQNRMQLSAPNRNDSGFAHTQSLNKSTDTFKLPNISDMSKNFGDRIYDKQSSATLQKSILVFSVPKAPRFGSGPKYAGQPSYYVDTCFKPNSTKGVGFGFGNKRQFPEWMEKNMKENPAPGTYFYQTKMSPKAQKKGNVSSHLHTRGPSFGISYKFYEKVTIPKEKSPQRGTTSNQRLKPIYKN